MFKWPIIKCICIKLSMEFSCNFTSSLIVARTPVSLSMVSVCLPWLFLNRTCKDLYFCFINQLNIVCFVSCFVSFCFILIISLILFSIYFVLFFPYLLVLKAYFLYFSNFGFLQQIHLMLQFFLWKPLLLYIPLILIGSIIIFKQF